MKVWVKVKPYQRRFLHPLNTAHGGWHWREGLLIQMRAPAGNSSLGEVAPIPWFGTETQTTAQEFWQGKTGQWTDAEALQIPPALPATQFGVGSALARLNPAQAPADTRIAPTLNNGQICGLLPAGERALDHLPDLLRQGHRTLKWKIGVFPLGQELAWLKALLTALPPSGRLRLDANGGLTYPEAEAWLTQCDALRGDALRSAPSTSGSTAYIGQVEHLEQPLPPEQFEAMRTLGQRFQPPLALDESVATLAQMAWCDRNAWAGLFVIKPAIAGAPQTLKTFLKKVGRRVIFSSAFETVIGRQAALQLALEHYRQHFPAGLFPALGFGTLNYFDDDWDDLTPEQLWERV